PITSVPAAVRDTVVWAAAQLDRQQRDFLAALPTTITIDVDALGAVLFCHATPNSDEEIFTLRTPEDRLRPMLSSTHEPIIVCGHTHMQFQRRLDGTQIVNAGSVGMPFGATGAHWLRLGPGIELERTDYDLASAAARLGRTAYPRAAEFASRYVLDPPSEAAMLAAFEAAEHSR
ncbi:MAG TPA: metallophosphoesterase family protein, partial [Gemmatimonadaceae bacterium]|nr:metallophosphoesterase family protein [Gemmatimonadaceae bacterium]